MCGPGDPACTSAPPPTVTTRKGAAFRPLTGLGVAEHWGAAAERGAAAEVAAAAAAAHAAPPHCGHDLDLLAGADCAGRKHTVVSAPAAGP